MNTIQLLVNSFGVFVTTFWWLILALLISLSLKTAFINTVIARIHINSLLKLFLDKNIYTVFNSVKLKTNAGIISIDHVVVSRYGVIVIKSLRIPGWLYGNDSEPAWLHSFCRHTNEIHNPVLQNQAIVSELQQKLSISQEKIMNLVVIAFTGKGGFKSLLPASTVISKDCIKWIDRHTTQLLTDAEVSSVCGKLKTGKYSEW